MAPQQQWQQGRSGLLTFVRGPEDLDQGRRNGVCDVLLLMFSLAVVLVEGAGQSRVVARANLKFGGSDGIGDGW
jgi:hypothetical protein